MGPPNSKTSSNFLDSVKANGNKAPRSPRKPNKKAVIQPFEASSLLLRSHRCPHMPPRSPQPAKGSPTT
eukprot:7895989-Pyramimonas_sp.AAC.1